jgi:hypothetical protein
LKFKISLSIFRGLNNTAGGFATIIDVYNQGIHNPMIKITVDYKEPEPEVRSK